MLHVSQTGTIGCWKSPKVASDDNKEPKRDLSNRSYFGITFHWNWLDALRNKLWEPISREQKRTTETMLHTNPTHLKICEIQMTNIDGNFSMNAEVNKVNKSVATCREFRWIITKKKRSCWYMLLLAHPNMLKSKLNEISGLKIKENKLHNAQYLRRKLYLVAKKQHTTIFC